MTEIIIRQATLIDVERLFNIQRAAILNIKDYLYSKEIKQAWAPKNAEQAKQIIRSEKYYTVVAEINSFVVGFGSISNNEFQLLFVDPVYQRNGVASEIMKHLENKVQHPIEMKVPKNSVEFYHKRGYKIKSKFTTLLNNHVFNRFFASKD